MWAKNGYAAPMKFYNKPNKNILQNTLDGAPLAISEQVEGDSVGGAIKFLQLAGAIFRYKDDKKGQQDAYNWFMEEECGQIQQFPNISAVCYGTFGTGAAHIMANLNSYRKFMTNVCYSKDEPGLTNIERNVSDGLEDILTLTELCVHTLYSEFVPQPLVQELHAYGIDRVNGISLGPLHDAVLTHLSKTQSNPSLWLTQGSSFVDASLKSAKIRNTEAIEAAHVLSLH